MAATIFVANAYDYSDSEEANLLNWLCRHSDVGVTFSSTGATAKEKAIETAFPGIHRRRALESAKLCDSHARDGARPTLESRSLANRSNCKFTDINMYSSHRKERAQSIILPLLADY